MNDLALAVGRFCASFSVSGSLMFSIGSCYTYVKTAGLSCVTDNAVVETFCIVG